MKRADLLIAHNKGVYNIKVEGRANFEYGLPLRDFAKNLEGKYEKVSIDLKSCTGMDSTFMGVLAMIGLKSRKIGAVVEIINADANNRHLLIGLGLEKLFAFIDRQDTQENIEWQQSESGQDRMTTAETVVEAHKTLMNVDQNNVSKFEKVVEFAQEDLDKLKKSTQ